MYPQVLLNALISSAHCALVAAGFVLIYRCGKFFNFAHAATYVLSSYAAYGFALVTNSASLVVAPIIGAASGALAGAGMELCVYRPLRQRGASSLGLLVASLGILIACQNIVSLLFGDDTKRFPLGPSLLQFEFGGLQISHTQACLLAWSLAAGILLMIGLKFTSLGIRIRAVSNDAELALIVGVNVHEIIMVSFLVGSALAGAAGVLWAFNSALTPGGGFSALLMGMTAAVIGGVRSLRGTVLGSVLVGVVRELTGWWFSSEWQDAALFLVLIGFMLLSPRGPAGRHTAEKAR